MPASYPTVSAPASTNTTPATNEVGMVTRPIIDLSSLVAALIAAIIAAATSLLAAFLAALAATATRGLANVTATGTSTVIAAVVGKKIRVYGLYYTPDVPMNLSFGTNGVAFTPTIYAPARGGAVLQQNMFGWYETNVGEALTVSIASPTSGALNLGVFVLYTTV